MSDPEWVLLQAVEVYQQDAWILYPATEAALAEQHVADLNALAVEKHMLELRERAHPAYQLACRSSHTKRNTPDRFTASVIPCLGDNAAPDVEYGYAYVLCGSLSTEQYQEHNWIAGWVPGYDKGIEYCREWNQYFASTTQEYFLPLEQAVWRTIDRYLPKFENPERVFYPNYSLSRVALWRQDDEMAS